MTRILIIEDEDSYRDATSFMLRKEGYDVVDRAPTAPKAWRSTTGTARIWCCWT